MNLLMITGNIGRDVEVRQTGKGTTVASFSMAVQTGWGDNQKTQWYRCSIFGKRAEGKLTEYLLKGQKVLVTGEPSLNIYEKDGKTNAGIDVFVSEIELLGSKEKVQQDGNQAVSGGFEDDPLPF